MSTPLERLHRHRERQRSGVMVLQIEVCLADHRELLLTSGELAEWDDGDRDQVARATERLLVKLAKQENGG